jgi:hypothetical protein
MKFLQPDLDLLDVVANATNHGLDRSRYRKPISDSGFTRKTKALTHHHRLGPETVYLLEAFKGHGVQLALQQLGVEGVYVGFQTRYVYLSTVLSLHFVAGMKHRPRHASD